MKKTILSLAAAMICIASFGQESETKGEFGISTDIVSRYVWRGTQFSTAPSIQPGITYAIGGFTVGGWGNYDFDNSATECDLYAKYDFEFGLGVVVNDYFFPDITKTGNYAASPYNGYFDTEEHTFEVGLTYEISNFSLGAYKYVNQNEDMYVEAAYAFKNAKLFVGAGDEAYTNTGDFNVCNVGLTVSKEVALTETWKVAPYASFVVNPNREAATLVLGITL